jgi:hypothetical protein
MCVAPANVKKGTYVHMQHSHLSGISSLHTHVDGDQRAVGAKPPWDILKTAAKLIMTSIYSNVPPSKGSLRTLSYTALLPQHAASKQGDWISL